MAVSSKSAETPRRERRQVVIRRLAGKELGDDSSCKGREREAERRVSRSDDEVLVGLEPADDRQPVGRAAAEAAPDLARRPSGETPNASDTGADDRVDTPAVNAEVEAGQLERAGEPQPSGQGGHYNARLVKEERDARVGRLAVEVDVVPLPTLDRQSDCQASQESRRPHSSGKDDLVSLETTRGRLDGRHPLALRLEAQHLGAGVNCGSGIDGGSAHRAYELERVARELVRVEDRPGDGALKGRLERAGRICGEMLEVYAGRGVCGRLGARSLEQRLGLVDVQRPRVLEGEADFAAERLEEGEARPRQLTQYVGAAAFPCWRAGRREADEPGNERRTKPERERCVLAQAPAEPLEECGTRRERERVTRAEQPGVSSRTAGADRGTSFEDANSCATARKFERTGDADCATAHDDHVARHGQLRMSAGPDEPAGPPVPAMSALERTLAGEAMVDG